MATHNKVFLQKTGGGYSVTSRSEQQRRSALARRSAVQLARAIATPPPGYVFAGQQSAAAAVQARTMGRPGPRGKEVKSFDLTIHNNDPVVQVAAVVGKEPTAVQTGMTELNDIPPGTGFYQRIGSRIVMKSIAVKMHFLPADNTPVTVIRVMLVYDRQVNKAFAGIGDLLATNDGAATFSSGINMQNKNRFLILRDQFVTIDAGQGLDRFVSMYVKGRWETDFSGTAGNAVADISTGAVYLLWFYGSKVGAGAVNAVDISTRVRYDDT